MNMTIKPQIKLEENNNFTNEKLSKKKNIIET